MQCSIRTHVYYVYSQFDRSPTWLSVVDSVFAKWLPSAPSLSSAKWGCSRTGLLVCASCFMCLFPLRMDYHNISVAPVRVKWRRSSASCKPFGSRLARALKRPCRLLAESVARTPVARQAFLHPPLKPVLQLSACTQQGQGSCFLQ